jgi:hypothetical protein
MRPSYREGTLPQSDVAFLKSVAERLLRLAMQAKDPQLRERITRVANECLDRIDRHRAPVKSKRTTRRVTN